MPGGLSIANKGKERETIIVLEILVDIVWQGQVIGCHVTYFRVYNSRSRPQSNTSFLLLEFSSEPAYMCLCFAYHTINTQDGIAKNPLIIPEDEIINNIIKALINLILEAIIKEPTERLWLYREGESQKALKRVENKGNIIINSSNNIEDCFNYFFNNAFNNKVNSDKDLGDKNI